MWMFKPCCGLPLKWSVKFLAWISLILMIVALICRVLLFDWEFYVESVTQSFGKFNITGMGQGGDEEVKALVDEYFKANFYTWLVGGSIYLVVLIILEIFVFRIIIQAANKDDDAACRKWLILRSISTVFYFAFTIICIATGFDFDWRGFGMNLVNIVHLYQIWVVYEYKQQIG